MTCDPGCLNDTPDDPMSDEDIYEANVREYDALVDELNFGRPTTKRMAAITIRMDQLAAILEPAS
jgi:hypothetical protein